MELIAIQISTREMEHIKKYPKAEVISLGIGDTTAPIPDIIASAMSDVSITYGFRFDRTCCNLQFVFSRDGEI